MFSDVELGFIKEAKAEQKALSQRNRFAVLDGLRGIAAVAVVLFHSFQDSGLFINAQLAVDLFFILSGFVVAYSYEDRLLRPRGRTKFLLARIVRLYPMLLIGACGGIAEALLHNHTNPTSAYPYFDIALSGGLSLFLLPYLKQNSINDHAFSFNSPMWSLFFEAVANAIYAFTARFLSLRVLTAIVVVSLIAVAWLGPLGGAEKERFFAGFPRVMAGFFGGVLLFKVYRRDLLPRFSGNIFICAALVIAVFVYPREIEGIAYIFAFGVLILAVMGGAASTACVHDGWCEFLGLISYPVYLIHPLTLYFISFTVKKVGLEVPLSLLHLVLLPFIGYLLARYYETPVRLRLGRALKLRKEPASASLGPG